ncbi:amidophosphoribosyltransferase [Deinococcus aerolatus]|uniref:Amidophosphoribosyltransferase n=1 Tax=Deinococcus aerolatus TaxID=522487 RepID=A0ABQ2GF14_9DEIO|nr:ComF family protein [Deinococcus aerolatus]GGL91091.1 amidophosphoribosyltransferase [Deinococcus aerolatus]
MLASLWRTLLPRACPGCGAQLGTEAGLCRACRAGLTARVESHSPLRPRPEPHLVTLGRYQGVGRRAVRALKFGGARDLAGVLGEALAAGVPPEWGVGAVVPVPLHPSRQRQRGYNQAELLAREVARQLGVPCVDALRRTRATHQQARQQAAGRHEMAGAFAVRPGRLPSGPLLLLDDVMTSGSTLLACQDALHAAGAAEVYVAVVAR